MVYCEAVLYSCDFSDTDGKVAGVFVEQTAVRV